MRNTPLPFYHQPPFECVYEEEYVSFSIASLALHEITLFISGIKQFVHIMCTQYNQPLPFYRQPPSSHLWTYHSSLQK